MKVNGSLQWIALATSLMIIWSSPQTAGAAIPRTRSEGTNALPDKRAFEMVSPSNNENADVYIPYAVAGASISEGIHTELPFEVANDGHAVTYLADPIPGGGTGKGGVDLGDQYLARYSSGSGWQQINIQPSARNFTYYRGFSSDLSTGVLLSGREPAPRLPPLSEGAPGEGYGVLYSCTYYNGPCVIPGGGPGTPYVPLNAKPLHRSASEFATSEQGHRVHITYSASIGGPVFADGSNDFRHMLFEANDALPGIDEPLAAKLDENVTEEISRGERSDYLYDRTATGLDMVNVLPLDEGGSIASNATFGAPPLNFEPESNQPNFDHVISENGNQIFWTDIDTGVIYARLDGNRSVRVSSGSARYWSASTDGSQVLYTESGKGEEGREEGLYEFNVTTGIRVTLVPPSANVLGVAGASNDLSSVYFVAKGVIGEGPNGEGVTPQAGLPNLYLAHSGEPPVFIATLSEANGRGVAPFNSALASEGGEHGDWLPGLGGRTAEASANGKSLVFMSDLPLATEGFQHGYPNAEYEEIYVYSAEVNRLFCVSCRSNEEMPSTSARGAAAYLPISWIPTYLPEWINSDGDQVFFDSAVPLVAQDTNGEQDVYEWEKERTGSCTAGSGENGGCIYLLSGGASEVGSWLLGSSDSGGSVFFVTRAQLVGRDQNEAFDLYDARVEGGEALSRVTCVSTSCETIIGVAPAFERPVSVTFEGLGNLGDVKIRRPRVGRARALRACTKLHNRKKRKGCIGRARRYYKRSPHREIPVRRGVR